MSVILTSGDGEWAFTCDWCGRFVREDDITETLDGSELCPTCIEHYDGDQDAEEGDVVQFISNINDEERAT